MAGITPPTSNGRRRLGDVIVDLGFADRDTVEGVAVKARDEGRQVGEMLVESGVLSSDQLARALAERNGLDYVDLNIFEVDTGAANLVSSADARRFRAVPVAFLDPDTILVATSNPANVLGIDDIAMTTGYKARLAVASPEDIEAVINQISHLEESVQEVEEETDEGNAAPIIELRASAEEAPVVKLVHSLIADAVARGASDIHFDPRDGDMRARFRIDGVVVDSATVPRRLALGLVSRIKIMAELDIAERRAPQDGRVGLRVDDHHVDLRVATLPLVRGESVVLRILDKQRVVTDLDLLGMEALDRDLLKNSINQLRGAVLATGPTGAGKTTTLYAALSEINTPDRTLITIEDPVEYELEGVKQMQVNPAAGVTFARGLRSMLRNDPDVLMVGEIRDRETAQTAIESALTGHLVLSTLHTNDAPMAPVRLIDMGIEPFLVATGIECVIAQRLARRLCEDCRRPVEITAEALRSNGFEKARGPISAYEPEGCVRCGGTGFRGRVGLYEVMMMSNELRALILRKASGDEIAATAVAAGMRRLREDGLEKVRNGITSMSEMLRVVGT
ncbi:MAG TPA: ATPase, T2SS/T4P/T4SS family [Solirubrobacterales bacterium]|nr:ATPase, T2SS/T4P/T4SS family [Solirubrobacterales bacterium]